MEVFAPTGRPRASSTPSRFQCHYAVDGDLAERFRAMAWRLGLKYGDLITEALLFAEKHLPAAAEQKLETRDEA